MCKHINWTAEMDATIRQMRGSRFSWDAIALACGVSHRQQIIERAKDIGVTTPSRQDICEDDAERGPMAAGSLASWGAINAGLSIAGQAFVAPGAP